jgi:hypothetical protein
MGRPWAQLEQNEKQLVQEMQDKKDALKAEGRAAAQQRAALEVPDKPTAGEREHLAQDLTTIGRLDALGSMFNPEFVGPARGRWGNLKEFFGATGIEESAMRAEVATIKNSVIQMITGAAVGVQEAGRIMAQLPDMTQSPETFAARWQQTRENAIMLAQKRRDIMKQTGIDVSRLAPLPATKASLGQAGAFDVRPEEQDMARQMLQAGKSKDEVMAAIQKQRGGQ